MILLQKPFQTINVIKNKGSMRNNQSNAQKSDK